MKSFEITKKGKIILFIILPTIIIMSLTLILGYNLYTSNNEINGIYLDAENMSEGDKMDYEQSSLILHIDSKAKLIYNTIPNNKNINVSFKNYDKNIININSDGVITALKTGKTQIQVFDEKTNITSNIIKVYVY